MYKHLFKKRVRYSETDKMGYLYYGNYAALYEIGRVEFIRSLGVSYRSLEDDHGIMLPVVHMESKFHKPLYYDEEASIITVIEELPTKILKFHHEIRNEKDELVNTGVVKLFFVEKNTGKRISTPTFIIDKLAPHYS